MDLDARIAALPATGLGADPDAAFDVCEFTSVATALAAAGEWSRAAKVLSAVTGPAAPWPLPWGSICDVQRLELAHRLAHETDAFCLAEADLRLWDAAACGDIAALAAGARASQSAFWADLAASLGEGSMCGQAAECHARDAALYERSGHPARAVNAARQALRWLSQGARCEGVSAADLRLLISRCYSVLAGR